MITDNLDCFIKSIISQIPFDVADLELDHFGYQASSAEDYEKHKKDSFKIGDLISENIVSDRRVAIFRFKQPVMLNNFEISGFELVEPKEGQECKSELDHLEFVIPMSFDEYTDLYKEKNWDLYAKDREEFPKIMLKLKDGKSAKFHTKNVFEEIPD